MNQVSQEPSTNGASDPAHPTAGTARDWRVMIVSDFACVAALEADVVARSGEKPTAAASASDALGLLRTSWFDLIVLDADLPSTGGLPILDYLETQLFFKQIPVIAVSRNPKRLRKTPQIVDIVPKPLKLEELQRTITRLLASPRPTLQHVIGGGPQPKYVARAEHKCGVDGVPQE